MRGITVCLVLGLTLTARAQDAGVCGTSGAPTSGGACPASTQACASRGFDQIVNFVDTNAASDATSAFANRADGTARTYEGHQGIDFAMAAGSPVYPIANGTLVERTDGRPDFTECTAGLTRSDTNATTTATECESLNNWAPFWGGGSFGWGNSVVLRSSIGGDSYTVRYGHLKNGTVLTGSTGDCVTAGTSLGEIGLSGYTFGPHLHLELRKDGSTVTDPYGAGLLSEGSTTCQPMAFDVPFACNVGQVSPGRSVEALPGQNIVFRVQLTNRGQSPWPLGDARLVRTSTMGALPSPTELPVEWLRGEVASLESAIAILPALAPPDPGTYTVVYALERRDGPSAPWMRVADVCGASCASIQLSVVVRDGDAPVELPTESCRESEVTGGVRLRLGQCMQTSQAFTSPFSIGACRWLKCTRVDGHPDYIPPSQLGSCATTAPSTNPACESDANGGGLSGLRTCGQCVAANANGWNAQWCLADGRCATTLDPPPADRSKFPVCSAPSTLRTRCECEPVGTGVCSQATDCCGSDRGQAICLDGRCQSPALCQVPRAATCTSDTVCCGDAVGCGPIGLGSVNRCCGQAGAYCTSSAECCGTQICDPSLRRCVANGVAATCRDTAASTDCAPGSSCRAATGEVTGRCSPPCDFQTGLTTTGETCGVGAVCGRDGFCTPCSGDGCLVACSDTLPCPNGSRCDPTSGRCQAQCSLDGDRLGAAPSDPACAAGTCVSGVCQAACPNPCMDIRGQLRCAGERICAIGFPTSSGSPFRYCSTSLTDLPLAERRGLPCTCGVDCPTAFDSAAGVWSANGTRISNVSGRCALQAECENTACRSRGQRCEGDAECCQTTGVAGAPRLGCVLNSCEPVDACVRAEGDACSGGAEACCGALDCRAGRCCRGAGVSCTDDPTKCCAGTACQNGACTAIATERDAGAPRADASTPAACSSENQFCSGAGDCCTPDGGEPLVCVLNSCVPSRGCVAAEGASCASLGGAACCGSLDCRPRQQGGSLVCCRGNGVGCTADAQCCGSSRCIAGYCGT